jgi:hypothetical protein
MKAILPFIAEVLLESLHRLFELDDALITFIN